MAGLYVASQHKVVFDEVVEDVVPLYATHKKQMTYTEMINARWVDK